MLTTQRCCPPGSVLICVTLDLYLFVWVYLHVFVHLSVYACIVCFAVWLYMSVCVCLCCTANIHVCCACLSLFFCMPVCPGVCHCGVVCLSLVCLHVCECCTRGRVLFAVSVCACTSLSLSLCVCVPGALLCVSLCVCLNLQECVSLPCSALSGSWGDSLQPGRLKAVRLAGSMGSTPSSLFCCANHWVICRWQMCGCQAWRRDCGGGCADEQTPKSEKTI